MVHEVVAGVVRVERRVVGQQAITGEGLVENSHEDLLSHSVSMRAE